VRGDNALLERAVVNALNNAVSHNVPSGWVDVRMRTAQGRALLVVANSGLVLTQAEADELELPFRRAGSDRTDSARGVGLGLTIVREVVDHHDGTLRVRALPRGGLSVEICIPLFDGSR
jgi:signal transduction histidine kinase